MDTALQLFVVALLIGLNGLFVAAELSLVASRPTRIAQMAEAGNRRAKLVQRAMSDPNRFISACQVGITLAGLGLGWMAEPAIGELIEPLITRILGDDPIVSARVISFALAFVFVTIVLIVLGELVPKMIALQKSEQTILATAGIVNGVSVLFRPIIALLYWLTGAVLNLLGLEWQQEHALVYTEEELKMLVTASRSKGYLEKSEQEMIERAFEFADATADEVMIPRTELVAIPLTAKLDEVIDIVAEHQLARYPVYENDLDHIVGVLNAKDLLQAVKHRTGNNFDLRNLLKPALFVSEHTDLDHLLARMKAERSHSAIVIDEYGGTAGMVTLGDVVERVFGSLDDVDVDQPEYQTLANGNLQLSGLMSVDEVCELLDEKIDEPFYNTVAGYIFGQLGRQPEVGDRLALDRHLLTVQSMDGLRIDQIVASPLPRTFEEMAEAESDQSMAAVTD